MKAFFMYLKGMLINGKDKNDTVLIPLASAWS